MVADSKTPWSGFPNPLVPSLTHPGGLGNPPHTINDRWITGQRKTPAEHYCQKPRVAILIAGAVPISQVARLFPAWFKRRFQFRVARVDVRRVCLSPFAPRKYFRGAKGDVALTPSPCYPRNS